MKNFKKLSINLAGFSRIQKQFILLLADFLILEFSLFLSFVLRFETFYPILYLLQDWWLFVFLPIITIPFFIRLGLYRSVLKHIDSKTILSTIKSITGSTIILGFLMMMVREESFSRSIFVIYWFVSMIIVSGIRYLAHWFIYVLPDNVSSKIAVAIYGAGDAGIMLSESIAQSNRYNLKAIFDDDNKKVNTIVKSVKIYSSSDIQNVIKDQKLKIILLAIPSIGRSYRKQILNKLSKFPIRVMELPSVENIIDERVTIDDIKKVEVEDILGRSPIKAIQELLSKNILNKNILISGAGGSIGSELCRQIYKLNPKTIILYEMSEFNLYSIHKELINYKKNIEIIPILGSVTHKSKINIILNKYNINTVFHTAAYKHVPMVENNPCSGVYNNVLGTYNMVQQSIKNNVETFILISTDKAVRPTNIMGASKRFCELILQAFDKQTNTKLSMVRFGNVLDSAGSVLPLFRKQINQGGPLTVTHKEIIRYFMSIPEAVQLVIQAGAMANGGEVFILDMGEPINIMEMAKKMIYLSGLVPKDKENPNGDISIKITGLRPGEKLFEELLINNSSKKTDHPRIMKANENCISNKLVLEGIEAFKNACKQNDEEEIKNLLIKYVEEFKLNP
jgi:FlaA1/EpsC-like NDP-sugar epimerase